MAPGRDAGRTYLGVPVRKPRVAFLELSSCEGCQLQLLNDEGSLLDFLSLVEIVDFREAMSERSAGYEAAFVEGSVTRDDEAVRLVEIRKQAGLLVAFGSCACFGGINQLRNRFEDLDWVKRQAYGDQPVDTAPRARPVEAVVPVDLRIPGCPVRKEEVEKIVLHLALGRSLDLPRFPVCMECKANGTRCVFDTGEPCLGPATRGGCGAWCPEGGTGCWGCRGPAEDANLESLLAILHERGFTDEEILDRFECFGGFAAFADSLRTPPSGNGGRKP